MTTTTPKRKPGRPARTDVDASAIIRTAALNVFAQKGFDRASIVDIANAANVAKPLIHYHYATKDALWQAAVSQAQLALMAELMSVQGLLSNLKPLQSIELLSKKLIEFAAHHPQLVRIVVDETGKGGSRAEWLFEQFLLPSYALSRVMIEKVSKDLKLGARKPKAEHLVPTVLGVMYFPFLESGVIQRAYGKDVYSPGYIQRQSEVLHKVLLSFFVPFNVSSYTR
jgi:AcrR family transcriptional regulator